jgi:hypothetical protein
MYFQVQVAGSDATATTKIQIDADGNIIFSDDVQISDDLKLYFRDSAIYINSGADGYLDLEADTGIRFNAPVTLANEGLITAGGVVLGDSTPDAAGEVGFDGTDKYSFYGANSDDFYFRVGSAANTVTIGSSTSVADIYSLIPFRSPAKFLSYDTAQTLTAATHNGAMVMMTVAGEVTMWDCTASTIGDLVTLWARDAEKIEVVPATDDQFYLFNGTGIGANDELDMAATAGTKVTLMCTAANEWRVVFETAACADGGAAD